MAQMTTAELRENLTNQKALQYLQGISIPDQILGDNKDALTYLHDVVKNKKTCDTLIAFGQSIGIQKQSKKTLNEIKTALDRLFDAENEQNKKISHYDNVNDNSGYVLEKQFQEYVPNHPPVQQQPVINIISPNAAISNELNRLQTAKNSEYKEIVNCGLSLFDNIQSKLIDAQKYYSQHSDELPSSLGDFFSNMMTQLTKIGKALPNGINYLLDHPETLMNRWLNLHASYDLHQLKVDLLQMGKEIPLEIKALVDSLGTYQKQYSQFITVLFNESNSKEKLEKKMRTCFDQKKQNEGLSFVVNKNKSLFSLGMITGILENDVLLEDDWLLDFLRYGKKEDAFILPYLLDKMIKNHGSIHNRTPDKDYFTRVFSALNSHDDIQTAEYLGSQVAVHTYSLLQILINNKKQQEDQLRKLSFMLLFAALELDIEKNFDDSIDKEQHQNLITNILNVINIRAITGGSASKGRHVINAYDPDDNTQPATLFKLGKRFCVDSESNQYYFSSSRIRFLFANPSLKRKGHLGISPLQILTDYHHPIFYQFFKYADYRILDEDDKICPIRLFMELGFNPWTEKTPNSNYESLVDELLGEEKYEAIFQLITMSNRKKYKNTSMPLSIFLKICMDQKFVKAISKKENLLLISNNTISMLFDSVTEQDYKEQFFDKIRKLLIDAVEKQEDKACIEQMVDFIYKKIINNKLCFYNKTTKENQIHTFIPILFFQQLANQFKKTKQLSQFDQNNLNAVITYSQSVWEVMNFRHSQSDDRKLVRTNSFDTLFELVKLAVTMEDKCKADQLLNNFKDVNIIAHPDHVDTTVYCRILIHPGFDHWRKKNKKMVNDMIMVVNKNLAYLMNEAGIVKEETKKQFITEWIDKVIINLLPDMADYQRNKSETKKDENTKNNCKNKAEKLEKFYSNYKNKESTYSENLMECIFEEIGVKTEHNKFHSFIATIKLKKMEPTKENTIKEQRKELIETICNFEHKAFIMR